MTLARIVVKGGAEPRQDWAYWYLARGILTAAEGAWLDGAPEG
jgi:hypothetical protein